MKTNLKILSAISCLVISACSDPTDFDFDRSLEAVDAGREAIAALEADAPSEAVFDPANAEIPFPNTLLFGDDGTLNVPIGDVAEDDFSSPAVALNTLDGFSTTQPVTTDFSKPIDQSSVILGESVFAFKVVTDDRGLVTSVERELSSSEISAVVVDESTIAFAPRVPLAESSDYLFVVSNAVSGPEGPVNAGRTFRLVSGSIPLTGDIVGALEPLRISVNAMLAALDGQVEAANVVQAWTTRTQSITPVLESVASSSQQGGVITLAPTMMSTSAINPASPGRADVYIGSLEVPYYLQAPANANDPAGITSFWRGENDTFLTAQNAVPVATSLQTIPVLMSVPNAASGQVVPNTGWPVAIFIHGILGDRTNMLALADSMASVGFAVIAIDQAMHGITDPDNDLHAANTPFPNIRERTFGIDLANNETLAPGPDGVVDFSGMHFYSPRALLTTRDNLRQSVADFLMLSASIQNIASVPVDASRKALIGHSLGGTTATMVAAFDNTLASVSLGMPAAGLAQTTFNSQSPNIGDPIRNGLTAAAIAEGFEADSPEAAAFIASFLGAAQTVADPADPLNFASMVNTPVHMIEVIGDATVPNLVPDTLAGTEVLAALMGLTSVTADANSSGIVRFIAGDHVSLLSPAASVPATQEMQRQVATFASSAGALISITDTSVIQTQ